MKFHFSRSRETNLGHFSPRFSRDRDSCQCLLYRYRFRHFFRYQIFPIPPEIMNNSRYRFRYPLEMFWNSNYHQNKNHPSTRYPTLPGFYFYYPYPTRNFFKISGFRVVTTQYTCCFQSRIISMRPANQLSFYDTVSGWVQKSVWRRHQKSDASLDENVLSKKVP